jgi:hypothetical protein
MKKPDHTVGYKRPPRHTQFKPGQSGNPKGRPKGTKNLRTDLGEELAEKITVTEGGQQLFISKQRAMLKSLMARSIKGETAAARALINLIVGLEMVDVQDKPSEPLASDDLEILAEFKKRILRHSNDEGDSE